MACNKHLTYQLACIDHLLKMGLFYSGEPFTTNMVAELCHQPVWACHRPHDLKCMKPEYIFM